MTPVGEHGEPGGPPLGIDAWLARVRERVRRVTLAEAVALRDSGGLLIDTRTELQRAEQGELPGAIVIDRTVLEWRLDPTCEHCIPEVTGQDQPVVVVCRQGYSSSLAAANLRAIGLANATDLIGGVEGWIAAGQPVDQGPADVRR